MIPENTLLDKLKFTKLIFHDQVQLRLYPSPDYKQDSVYVTIITFINYH